MGSTTQTQPQHNKILRDLRHITQQEVISLRQNIKQYVSNIVLQQHINVLCNCWLDLTLSSLRHFSWLTSQDGFCAVLERNYVQILCGKAICREWILNETSFCLLLDEDTFQFQFSSIVAVVGDHGIDPPWWFCFSSPACQYCSSV